LDFSTGDLVLIDAGNVEAIARVRSSAPERLHVALEPGAFLPWTGDPVSIRRCNDIFARAHAAKIVHASTATATLEMIPEANDTERDVAPPSVY